MPWNGSGVFSRIHSWVADRDAGLDILADRMDADTNDIASGLMHCLAVNGETVPVANLPMGAFRHTGASAGVADSDYATVGQVKAGGGGIAAGGFVPIAGGTMTGDLTVPGLTVSGVFTVPGNISAGSLQGGTVTGTLLFGQDMSLTGNTTMSGQLQVYQIRTTGFGIVPTNPGVQDCGTSGQWWNNVCSQSFQTISDRALKTAIVELPSSLGLVTALHPQRFRYAGDPAGPLHWGFVAQDVKRVMDAAGLEFGGHQTSDGHQALAYQELIAVLWKAVQELALQIKPGV